MRHSQEESNRKEIPGVQVSRASLDTLKLNTSKVQEEGSYILKADWDWDFLQNRQSVPTSFHSWE